MVLPAAGGWKDGIAQAVRFFRGHEYTATRPPGGDWYAEFVMAGAEHNR